MIIHFTLSSTLCFFLLYHFTEYSTGIDSNWTILESDDNQALNTDLSTGHCASDCVAASINDFALQLINQFDDDENLFISPFSIYVALSMTHLGAGGHTAEQLETALEIRKHNLNSTKLHEALKNLLLSLTQKNDQYSLLIANSLFVQQNFTIKEKYIDNLKQMYGAFVKAVDFAHNGQNAAKEINNWVSENTKNKIEKLVDGPLDSTTRLVLLNAIYFKGTWKIEFPKKETSDGRFFLSDGTSKEVKLMLLQKETFRFVDDSITSYKFLELPYKGNHIVMLLALPSDSFSPADLEMTPEILCRINRSMSSKKIDEIVIPKFKFEYEVELKDNLRGLGIKELFSKVANLSGIRSEKDLFVSSVLHKAVIDVNEEGSEAAAVTGVFIQPLSFNRKITTFIANRPFLFYIIDNTRGMILFSGRVADP